MLDNTSGHMNFYSETNDTGYIIDINILLARLESYGYALEQLEKQLREFTQGDIISKGKKNAERKTSLE